tara:strand:+ start:1013 stop:1531 length:519 start_codon:yes stop_codon:yes gene_type:complete
MNTFPLIVQKYREHTDSILRKGDFPLRETFNGFWGISVCEEVFELFKKLRLRYYNNFLDLGSGDGRVAAIASLFTNATGIESDKELYEKGLKIKNKLKLDCDFINKNFYEQNISKFDIVFCFPDSLDYRFEKKLFNELTGILVLAGPYSRLNSLSKKKIIEVNGTKFLVYSK